MEISSNSQYRYNKATTTIKQVRENKLENFVNYIDKTEIIESNKINENKKIESAKQAVYTYENYPYYFNNPKLKLESFTLYKFNIEQSKLPWEEQLLRPRYGLGEESTYQENLKWAKENNPLSYEWSVHLRDATNGNKYDDAPEFEAFVKKWMNKGESEDIATQRAFEYAKIGLLDYGKQKVGSMYGMPIEDIKQHGLWLIDNPPLSQAIIKTLDSLDYSDANTFIYAVFRGGVEHQYDDLNFNNLLKQYGIKLEDLLEKNLDKLKKEKYTFNGDVNLKKDSSPEAIEYNNFIFDTLINFFKDRIESLEKFRKNIEYEDEKEEFIQRPIDGINLLLDNLKITIDAYNKEK